MFKGLLEGPLNKETLNSQDHYQGFNMPLHSKCFKIYHVIKIYFFGLKCIRGFALKLLLINGAVEKGISYGFLSVMSVGWRDNCG